MDEYNQLDKVQAMTQSRLKIQAESLDLELTGDSDYVRDAYGAIQSVIIQRFRETLRKQDGPTDTDEQPKKGRRITKPLYQIDEVQKHMTGSRQLADQHIRLVVCNDYYHKVAVLSRDEFDKSIFGNCIDVEAIENVYINDEDTTALQGNIDIGKTLWRELTSRGRAAVEGDSS